jgi:hypothetical protein
MKALYDRSDRDYYIFFEKGDIKKLLEDIKLTCHLYSRSPGDDSRIGYYRQDFEIVVLDTNIDLFRKERELYKQKPRILYGYADVLIVYGEYELKTPCVLYLSKQWIKEGLSTELLNRCGKNEQRYGGGCKVHFYSEESAHYTKQQMQIVFKMEEAAWQRDYGHFKDCSVCGKPTSDNPFWAGDNPVCSQECLREWDEDHSGLDDLEENTKD